MNLALRRFPKPMNTGEAGHYWMTVLNPLLSVHPSSTLYSEALRTYAHYRISWYDALIVAAAVQADCAVLYSEDFQDGQTFGQDVYKRQPDGLEGAVRLPRQGEGTGGQDEEREDGGVEGPV